jgi:3',5'-cyclic AMP phosphodiesterase CpdA
VTTIAHISDLHFGTEDPQVAAALGEELRGKRPGLVAVSGDLTQRARTREFDAARRFLEGLGAPVLAVPGNHDIPLFDVVSRFLRPLRGYRRHISPDTDPFFHQEGLAVLGVNTARSNTWKDGRLSEKQIAAIRERLGALPPSVFKVLVTHHPFLPSPRSPDPTVVGRGLQGLLAAEACGVDLLLAGHLHHGFSGDVRAHYMVLHRSMLVAQAGTALSHRTRGEPNAYNWISVDPPHLALEVRAWTGASFETAAVTRYVKRADVWVRE